MIRKLQQLRRKKGFTLVELIVVVAIVGVLIASIAAFAGPIQRMVRATATDSDALNVNEVISEYIKGRLGFASIIEAHWGVDSSGAGGPLDDSVAHVASKLHGGTSIQGYGGKAGVLVFKYVKNTAQPELSTYMLYDKPITSAGSYIGPTEDDRVFEYDFYDGTMGSDGNFYSNSQRLFMIPKEIKTPGDYGTSYMSIDIYSYKRDAQRDDEYVNAGLYISDGSETGTVSTLNEATLYRNTKGLSGSDALKPLSVLRSGPVETVTFRLNNFTSGSITQASGGTATGSDILIFYYIPKFGSSLTVL